MKEEKFRKLVISKREWEIHRGIDWPIWYWICGIAIMSLLLIYEISHERKPEMLAIDCAILCMVIADMAEGRFRAKAGMYVSICAVVCMGICVMLTGFLMTENDGIMMRIVLIIAWSFIVVREVYKLAKLIKFGNFRKRKKIIRSYIDK